MSIINLEYVKTKYGDIVRGVWSNESQFCKLVEIPKEIGGSWINTHTRSFVDHIYCHIDFAPHLLEGLFNVKNASLLDELKSFDGCFNIRDSRQAPGHPSMHSWGMAIDINAHENRMGHPTQLSSGFIECFKKAGLVWGGDFKRTDPMHFSLGF